MNNANSSNGTVASHRRRFMGMTAWVVLSGALASCGGDGGGDDSTPSASPVSSTPAASNITIAMPYEQQQTGNWCWAAAEQMILASYGFAYQQADIVNVTFGQVVDSPASAQQIEGGLAELSNNGLAPTLVDGPLSLAQIRTLLAQNTPIIVSYANPQGGEGHVVVIFGVTATGNVLINDPIFGQFNVPYGNSFNYGTAGGPSLIWAQTIIP